jgi:aerobic-type carbon monoxide dehydrogenase small subunit (CoxS/CutS family)
LDKAPRRQFKADAPVRPAPTFKTRVDQRVFVPTLEEHLRKEFALTVLQRQSADWASKCCGYDPGQLVKAVTQALKDRQIRKTREQIARELAELEAARKKPPAPGAK